MWIRFCISSSLVLVPLTVSHRNTTSTQDHAAQSTKQCVSTTLAVDSAFAVRAASSVLQEKDSLGPFKPTKITALEEGYVVSLVVAKTPPPLGGGGLVWVDGESGCAIILRLYE